jgi:transcriptional regulator with PAS, ATPase and Fis domain
VRDSLVGSSSAMSELRAYIRKVARSDAIVLITGDTGTGKERVAESIHAESLRRHKPFVCVNCAAIPDSLLESELFGYDRGAFTGAQGSYPGKLRAASGGTVFLDEIGEMSLLAQAKILRVLESHEVFPLGALRMTTVDVRFIAATNQELEPLVAEGRFRRDLFYRLNVGRVLLRPLKDHVEDIPELIEHYVNRFNEHYHSHVHRPTQTLLDCLMRYDWPGNVRELRNLVEAMFIDPPEGPVSLEDLPESFRRIFARYTVTALPERERMVSALYDANWNKSRAAEQLNWSRMTLYRKLRKYRIDLPSGPESH